MSLEDFLHRLWLYVSDHLDKLTYGTSATTVAWSFVTNNWFGICSLIFVALTYRLNTKKFDAEREREKHRERREEELHQVKLARLRTQVSEAA